VEAQGERPVGRAVGEGGEFEAVRLDAELFHRRHGSAGPRRVPFARARHLLRHRGSCPCSGAGYRKYGGNTPCVALEADATPLLIMDLGTGLRALGEVLDRQLHRQGKPLEATALLTHLHFDHIMGLPFFRPLQDPGAIIDVYGPSQENMTLQEVMKSVVQPPFFPIEMSEFRGELRFLDTADDDLVVGNAKIRSRTVPHRGHTLGFRIEADSKTVVYLPDHQAPLDRQEVSDAVLELCEGADVLIHDAQYTDEEFTEKHDWGHSTVPTPSVSPRTRAFVASCCSTTTRRTRTGTSTAWSRLPASCPTPAAWPTSPQPTRA